MAALITASCLVLLLTACLGAAFPSLGPKEPPQYNETAKMARYIVRNSDWVSMATISTQKSIESYPFVSLWSVSDGTADNSTGVPYLYLTDLDYSAQDLKVNNKATILASLAESDYCQQQKYDQQDPRCARVSITGRILQIDNSTEEYQFGMAALLFKHPAMQYWPENHKFYVAKLDIENIEVFDYFGGAKTVTAADYFNAYKKHPTRDIVINHVDYIQIDIIL